MTVIMDATTMSTPSSLPLPAQRALRKLGGDLRDARLRRRIPAAVLAERASISRTTLVKVERGEPGVSLGIYAAVLFALGLVDRLAELADVRHDPRGLALDEEHLPKRIRRSRRPEARSREPESGP
jgi:transcriptional regulator with XRE-family HTH domain